MLGISKDTIHTLPEVHYPGRVILIDSAAKARDAVKYLLKQKQLGFDTETRPSFQKNRHYKVSLMQISTPEECFLFRLKMIGSLDGVMSVLENPDIQKIGLSLKDDFHSLAKLQEFTPQGFVELQTFVKSYEIADNSLQKIYALVFNRRISKNQRLTNWEAPTLTLSQQSYAAIDAWACVEIYNHLLAGRFNPAECPYVIDDETAIMLQSSVGIHTPLKHHDEEDVSHVEASVIAEPPALNGVTMKALPPRLRRQRKPKAEAAAQPEQPAPTKPAKPKKSKAKPAKAEKPAKPAKSTKVAKAAKSAKAAKPAKLAKEAKPAKEAKDAKPAKSRSPRKPKKDATKE